MFEVILFRPEIPPNTGNVIRMCANSGARLHLVEPLGFSMEDKQLRRAGLDYHELATVVVHPDWASCAKALGDRRIFAVTTRGSQLYTAIEFMPTKRGRIDVSPIFGNRISNLCDFDIAETTPMKSDASRFVFATRADFFDLQRPFVNHGQGLQGLIRPRRNMHRDLERWIVSAPRLECDWEALRATYRRSLVDLAALRFSPLTAGGRSLPAAGLPWFMTMFGRDSIFTSLQALPFTPELAATTLRELAARQGTRVDDFRDEDPGRILHEMRFGEMTAFEERPHSPYYGCADATPLFVVLLDEVERWTGDVALVDLSTSIASSAAAIAERFAQANEIDTFAVAKKFYATHPDSFDQILLWTDQPLIRDAFAYELTVANDVRGIGQDIYDVSRSLGSAGRLRSLVVMDWLGKYPEDPAQKFLGENSTLSVLGQEVGHRWLAYFEFRDRTGARSESLLGRDTAHWSFFFDSDASVMEGNDIEDQGGGQFRTVDAVKRFSRLDQYAMGLVGASGVPPFFYVESPQGTTKTSESAPSIGVSFTGTRRDVLIGDVIAIHGPRLPSVADSARVHRQAFIYIVTAGRATDAGQVAKLDRIRTAWEAFFLQATEGRMTAITRLR